MDDTTELDPAPRPLDGPERALAGVLARALDAGPAPAPDLLGAVERRAGRRHRRHRVVAAGSAAVVTALAAAVVIGVPSAGPGGGRATQAGVTALGRPPAVTAPPPVAASGDQPRTLTREEVEALLPGTPLVDVPVAPQLGEDRTSVDQASSCTTDALSSTPGRGGDAQARWAPAGPTAGPTAGPAVRGVQERVRTYADADGAQALLAAVAATADRCRPPAARAWPLAAGGAPGQVGMVEVGQDRWRVHVVAAVGATVVDVSADLAASDAATARDLVLGLWRAAAARVPAADRAPAPRSPSMVTHGPDPRR